MGNSLKIEGIDIKEELGGGSYGVVYKAKWNGRFAAVKVLRDDMFWCNPRAVEDFKKECEFLRVLKHPNIVEMYEVLFPENRSPVLITELMLCDLQSHYMNSKVSLDEVIRIMLDVGEGLKFLHEHECPIIHRDIKSKNILLNTKLKAKIADLGQAKESPLGTSRHMWKTPVPGTTVYMAPETFPRGNRQVRSDRPTVDYETEIDVFSFGVVLLEIIVGHVPSPKPICTPYKDGNIVREHNRRRKELGEMGTLHPLREIVLQCLENDPSRRPSISQVINDLRRNDGSQKRIELKIALLGNSGVGKSLLIKKYINKDLPSELVPSTIGVELHPVPLQIGNQMVILRILDPAGQERFDSIAPALFRGSHGAFLVYDISEPRSFSDLPKHLSFIEPVCGENVKVMLIGNKKDLQRRVHNELAQNYAEKNDMEYLEVSAVTLENVEEMFEGLAKKILESLDISDVQIMERKLHRSQSRIHLGEDDQEEPGGKCSC